VSAGVANATALIHLRACTKGDRVLVYHTGNEKAVVGLATIARGPYPDPSLDDPKRVVVDLKPVRAVGTRSLWPPSAPMRCSRRPTSYASRASRSCR
jgi:predicted RNA-binding protein with PUA-like domain